MPMLFDDVENRDKRIQMLLQTGIQLQQNQIAREENQLRKDQILKTTELQRAQNQIAAAELRQKAPLYKAQSKAYEAIAGQRNATTDIYESLLGGTPDEGGLQPERLLGGGGGASSLMLSGISPQGPRFENTGALREKERIQAEGAVTQEQYKLGTKLGGLSRRLNVLRKQYDEALPSSKDNPAWAQRVFGPAEVLGAKTGVAPNPKLLALMKNARLQAIQVIKMAGEAGNLAQQEQEEAAKAITSEGLTSEERKVATKQFLEVAIAGMSQEALEFVSKDPSFSALVKEVGVDLELVGMKDPSGAGIDVGSVNQLINSLGIDLGGAKVTNIRIKDKKK